MTTDPSRSLLTKAFSLLNGQVEFLHQLVVGAVGRKVEAVEAGVAPRQPSFLPHLLDAEALWTVAPCWKWKSSKFSSGQNRSSASSKDSPHRWLSLWNGTADPETHSSTSPSPQHSPMPDTAPGGRAGDKALGLSAGPGENSGLCPGEGASELDSMTRHFNAEENEITMFRPKHQSLLKTDAQRLCPN